MTKSGRVVMISGANRGIGEAIAKELYKSEYRISLGVRNPDSAGHLISLFGHERCTVHAYDASVAGSDSIWLDETLKAFGRIDVLINNAGAMADVSFSSLDFEKVDRLFQVNAVAMLRISQLAMDHLSKSRGRIINIVSMSGKRYYDGECVAYTISKFAAMGVSRILMANGRGRVQTTAICPGLVDTRMTSHSSVERSKMLKPEEVARVVGSVLMLSSNAVIEEIVINDAT